MLSLLIIHSIYNEQRSISAAKRFYCRYATITNHNQLPVGYDWLSLWQNKKQGWTTIGPAPCYLFR